MKEKEKMLKGMLYVSSDAELRKMHEISRKLMDQINATAFNNFKERETLCKKLFGSTGNDIRINKPFYCDYGQNIHIGDNFYANFDCILLDVNTITIGDNVMFGPRVSIYTATHPIDSEIRNEGLEYGEAVSIGDNVWVGGSATINPGVSIGDNSIIGAGSVVVKDIPENVIAVGNPCKVLRPITEEDRLYWQKKRQSYYQGI